VAETLRNFTALEENGDEISALTTDPWLAGSRLDFPGQQREA
jgi:hypothetical protein